MAKKVEQFDVRELREYQQHGEYLRQSFQQRNKLLDVMEDMFLMRWRRSGATKSQMNKARVTISPDARNAALGAIRLMTATEPIISVPGDKNDPQAVQVSEQVEVFCNALLNAAGRVAGNPIHYEMILSAIIFGYINVGITSTWDLVEMAQGGRDKAAMIQAEEAAQRTPYVFDAMDPRQCYPEFNNLGLKAFYRETKQTVSEVCATWGDAAREMFTEAEHGNRGMVTFCDYWDHAYHCAWVSGKPNPLLMEEHGLKFIPVVSHWVEGSMRMFEDEATSGRDAQWLQAMQVQPFLYSFAKSGMYDHQNLSLTVLYTNIFGVGAFPMFKHKRSVPDQPMELDFNTPGGVVHLNPGEDVDPFVRQTIDPAIAEGLRLADEKGMESMLYKQALGSPVGTDTYSTVALLNQAGRLPLVTAQRKGSWAIAELLEKSLRWVKYAGGKSELRYGEFAGELDAEMLPDRIQIEAKLDITLPQDKLQRANTAIGLTAGDDPLASKRWARENILSISQSDKMDEEIWAERAGRMLMQMYMDDQARTMAERMKGNGGNVERRPQNGGEMSGPAMGQMPGEMMGQMPGPAMGQGQVTEGMPMAGPMPGPEDMAAMQAAAQQAAMMQGQRRA